MFSRDASRKSVKFLGNSQLCLYSLLVPTVESGFIYTKQTPTQVGIRLKLELGSNSATIIQAEQCSTSGVVLVN